MAREPIDITCRTCEHAFSARPGRSFLGFRRVECPLCRALEYGPLSGAMRVAYWVLFSGLGLLILNDVDMLLRDTPDAARGHFVGSLAGAILWGLPVAWALFRDHELTTQSPPPRLGTKLRAQ